MMELVSIIPAAENNKNTGIFMSEKTHVPSADIAKARKIRKIRSELKRSIKNGDIMIPDIFADRERYDLYFANMRVHELVCAFPGYGTVGAEKLLKKLGINYCKKLKGLGNKQSINFLKHFNIKSNHEL